MWRRGVVVCSSFFPPFCIRRLPWLGVYEASGRLRRGKGGVIYSSRGCAGIIRAAFVLSAGRPPARPGWSAASPAAAGRSRHVVRGEKRAAAPCPASPFHSPSQSAGGRGGGKGEKKKPNNKPPQTHHFPAAPGTRSAGRQRGEPAAPPPSAEENAAPKGRRSHDGGCPHTTRSATGSVVPAAGHPSRRSGHGPAAAFHIINPPEFGGEAISWAGWRH